MRRISCLVSGVCVFIAAQSAFAQTDLERATARDAANNGRAAFDAGKYEKAIDYLSRAEQLVHSPTHLLFMARAQAKLGRLVAAHETYLKITRETLASNAPKAFVSAQDAAEQEQETLDARLPSVTVTLQGATTAPDTTVQMDGTPLPPAMIGIPLPADPGEHVFKATGPWIASDPVTVRLSEAAKQTVTLKLRSTGTPPAPVAPVASSSQTTPAATTAAAGAVTQEPKSASSGLEPEPQSKPVRYGKRHSVPLLVTSSIFFAAGIASGIVGGLYLVKANDTHNEAETLYDQCRGMNQGTCPDEERAPIDSKDNEADHQSKLGIVGMVGAGVGVATGLTLLIIDLSTAEVESARRSTPHVTPVFGLQSVGVVGTF